MKKLFSILSVVVILTSLAACKKPESGGSAGDEAIKKYILSHPEVLVESLQSYQRQEQEGESKKAEAVIKTRAMIFIIIRLSRCWQPRRQGSSR